MRKTLTGNLTTYGSEMGFFYLIRLQKYLQLASMGAITNQKRRICQQCNVAFHFGVYWYAIVGTLCPVLVSMVFLSFRPLYHLWTVKVIERGPWCLGKSRCYIHIFIFNIQKYSYSKRAIRMILWTLGHTSSLPSLGR